MSKILTIAVRFWWLWLSLAVLATYFITMLLSIGQSIWFDESYSIMLARRPVGELVGLAAVDVHPPLYYLKLKAWGEIFGWSEFSLRSLSAIFAALTVGVVFFIVKKLFTIRTALVTLPFLVIAPFALRYGYEVRMYALAGLIGALATLVLIYAVRNKKNYILWAIYAVLVASGMYTVYMMVALFVAHFVWLMIHAIKHKEKIYQQKWLYAYVGAVVLFLPWLPTFISQTIQSALPGIGYELTFEKIGYALSMVISYTPESQITGWLTLGLLFVLITSIYLMAVAHRKMPPAQRTYIWLVVVLAVVPISFFALLSLIGNPVFINRYLAPIAIYYYMFISVAIALGWRYGKRITSLLLAAVSLFMLLGGVIQLQSFGNFNFERWQQPRTAEARESISCGEDTVVVADDPYTYIDSHYYFSDCDLRFYRDYAVSNAGGYAPLHGSPTRVASSTELASKELVHLTWKGSQASFVPDERYQLVQSTTYDKQVIDQYEKVD